MNYDIVIETLGFDPRKTGATVVATLKARAQDIARRATKTFVQVAAGVLLVQGVDLFSLQTWKGAGLAGLAAAGSVVQNAISAALEGRVLAAQARDMDVEDTL